MEPGARSGQQDAATGPADDVDKVAPLAGVRVVDLTRLLPGDFCTWLLGSLGAEVLKVEDPRAGDYMRAFGHQVDGASAIHRQVNRGKRSVVLDLQRPEGRAVLERLVARASLLVESFRPGVLARLGFDPGRMRRDHPSLVIASISAYGATGSLSHEAGHDINYMAHSGLLDQFRSSSSPPLTPAFPLADLVGGALFPALYVLAALRQAEATGRGAHLDSSILEGLTQLPHIAVADMLAGVEPPDPGEHPYGGGLASYAAYACADGHVVVGALEKPFWRALCEHLPAPELVDRQHDDQGWLRGQLAGHFARLTRAQVEERFAGTDACVTVVRRWDEVYDSEFVRERELVRDDPAHAMPVLAPPIRFDGRRPPGGAPAPGHGDDSSSALLDWGFTASEVEKLQTAGTIGI